MFCLSLSAHMQSKLLYPWQWGEGGGAWESPCKYPGWSEYNWGNFGFVESIVESEWVIINIFSDPVDFHFGFNYFNLGIRTWDGVDLSVSLLFCQKWPSSHADAQLRISTTILSRLCSRNAAQTASPWISLPPPYFWIPNQAFWQWSDLFLGCCLASSLWFYN